MAKNSNSTSENPSALAILWQLIKEFGVPAILTSCWVAWDGRGQPNYDYVGKFSLLVMTISYLFLQWNRVAKQLRAERGLSSVQQGVGTMLEKLEAATTDIVGYATGGDSFCWLEPGKLYPLNRELVIHHQGKYPIRDVHIRLVDLQRFSENSMKAMTENIRTVDLIVPGHVRMLQFDLPSSCLTAEVDAFNVFFTTPNGSYNQCLCIAPVNGVLRCATLLENDGRTIMEKIDPDFPLQPDGTVDWNSHH